LIEVEEDVVNGKARRRRITSPQSIIMARPPAADLGDNIRGLLVSIEK
jgi:hypothetical protein